MELNYEKSRSSRSAHAQIISDSEKGATLPENFLRKDEAFLPELSELQVLRHYTQLSRLNFCIDTHFYPLGSCTMKYNPRIAHELATWPGFLNHHPLSDEQTSQGILRTFYELQDMLSHITGMEAVSLTPMAGAQGEFAGVAMIAAYHRSRGDFARQEMLVPDCAHGTNPASAAQCGFTVREVPTTAEGDVDLEALKNMVGEKTAGIMLTNPSTLGVFERQIKKIADIIHHAGGLLYYDGANLNAILGHYSPGDMGFDVVHLNLHKTFASPHGGGGPGAGPVAANKILAPFLPVPMVGLHHNKFHWLTQKDRPQSIGRLNTFMGNAGVLLRAYIYTRILGQKGLKRVSQYATLNANYLMKKLETLGFPLAFPHRRGSHEFIITLKSFVKLYSINALDFVKRLLDYGYHAPTIYFPLLIPECLLIEPTETESKETLDAFIEAMGKILEEAKNTPELLQKAPHHLPIGRLDEVKAAKDLNLIYTRP